MHFDGDKLNSLGEAKLDLMLKDDDSTDAMVVYMDLTREDPELKGRRDAVVNSNVHAGDVMQADDGSVRG